MDEVADGTSLCVLHPACERQRIVLAAAAQAVAPPSIDIAWPVMNDAPSDSK